MFALLDCFRLRSNKKVTINPNIVIDNSITQNQFIWNSDKGNIEKSFYLKNPDLEFEKMHIFMDKVGQNEFTGLWKSGRKRIE